MPDERFKRNIAYKFRIGDILIGKPIMNNERFSFLELGDKRILRVNIVGNIIDKYESEGENKYLSLTLDDGSGQIKLRCFREDLEKFRNIEFGQTVIVIGLLRFFNNEVYISPEIIRTIDAKYLLVRKLEIEKQRSKNTENIGKTEIRAIRDRILDMIKDSEENGGIETDAISTNLREISPTMINQEIKKLLEEGIIFEPLPGKVRWLG